MSDQQTNQPYAQQPPPPGYYQQGPPPKKKHTVRNVFLILMLLFVLFVGGCMALIGGALNEADKAIKKEEANDKPAVVTAGKAFTHDDFKVAAGWKVAKEAFGGGVTINGLKVTNDSDEERSALLSFRFYNGSENLAEVECSSNQLQGGESSKMDCYSTATEFPTGYKQIKVADTW
jgi:hypothetical protein